MDAGLLLCCTGPGGCQSQLEKPWGEKIRSIFVMGKLSVRDKGGERSPWAPDIALEGVSRDSLAAGPLASSRLENAYGLSKTQGLGEGIFFSRVWDSYFPLSIPVLHKYFKLAPVCSQLQPILHIFHVPHSEKWLTTALIWNVSLILKLWGIAYVLLCKRKCFSTLLFLNMFWHCKVVWIKCWFPCCT